MGRKLPKDTKVLLVDDEPDFRDALAFSFERKGYQVRLACNGREAFEMIQADSFDVVISDIRMPEGDGIELLERTKARHLDVPILLLVTGFADFTSEEAHNKGAEALFSKPFDTKLLEETVQRLLTPPAERWIRDVERIELDLCVELRFQGFTEAIRAKALSLGRGGMFVSLPEGQYPNVSVEVSFRLRFDGSSSLSGSGIVRWVRTKGTPNLPAGAGIEFTSLGDAERKFVLDFVTKNQPKAYIPNQ